MAATTFEDFLGGFFALFTQRTFRGGDYLSYLRRTEERRSGDEAAIVDTAVVGPLLGVLGFAPGERVYNLQRESSRPDFAPQDEAYGTCFIVEDKNTTHLLTLDPRDPNSDISQLTGYVRRTGARIGGLTNGRQFTLWLFEDPANPYRAVDLDLPTAVQAWTTTTPNALPTAMEAALRELFDRCHRGAFTNMGRLERELAVPLDVWQRSALPLGGTANKDSEQLLTDAVRALIEELQRDARRVLDALLDRYETYAHRSATLEDGPAPRQARAAIAMAREIVLSELDRIGAALGIGVADRAQVESILRTAEQDPRAYRRPEGMYAAILEPINEAQARRHASQSRKAPSWRNITDAPESLADTLRSFALMTYSWHQRVTRLRHEYRDVYEAHDDYTTWTALVQETMLGGLEEGGRRSEFALQAAYVVFIRLLLLRVCEDKGIFPHRFISDGGITHWQETIDRYLPFANGNPYVPLLTMAYENAQNIYAHFFTGRDIFNWYALDRERLIRTLHRLNRFDFSGVDSDIIGAIYSTYLDRKQKKEKGQYYTPPAIVEYILDTIGYTEGRSIIGANKRILDPACGSGSLLVTAAKRLVAAYRDATASSLDPIAVLERVQDTIFGFDLNPFACYLAEVNLLIQTLDLVKMARDAGGRPRLGRFNIYNVDALSRPTAISFDEAGYDTTLAADRDEADRIKRRAADTPYANGFAFVVANPPYGAALTADYKRTLRTEWPAIFFGQPDTYTFFLHLGASLLSPGGAMGFITPNTYLMGINTRNLREVLLDAGRIEEIVDLPRGIWPDANVDCVLLFLRADPDPEARKSNRVRVHLMGRDESLAQLTGRTWRETLTQVQGSWRDDPQRRFEIRRDALLTRIEAACLLPTRAGSNGGKRVLRLGDVTDSTQGIIPFLTAIEGATSPFIKPECDVPPGGSDWKKLLDSGAFVGRYEVRWGPDHPFLKYGAHLARPREAKYFDRPKLLVQDVRNRSLARRLVASFDDTGFYNRHNLSNIIARDKPNVEWLEPGTALPAFELKYLLALFNSRLLNYWYARRFDNLHINPDHLRELPIVPADVNAQQRLVSLVDDLIAANAELNKWRSSGYVIAPRTDGAVRISIPYDGLQAEVRAGSPHLGLVSLYDAEAMGLFTIPAACDRTASVSGRVSISSRRVVLRHNRFWLDVPDEGLRRYLAGYLGLSQWRGKGWDEIKMIATVWEDDRGVTAFFTAEERRRQEIEAIFQRAMVLDARIDALVLDLYGIDEQLDRAHILGSVPAVDGESVPEPPTNETEGEATST